MIEQGHINCSSDHSNHIAWKLIASSRWILADGIEWTRTLRMLNGRGCILFVEKYNETGRIQKLEVPIGLHLTGDVGRLDTKEAFDRNAISTYHPGALGMKKQWTYIPTALLVARKRI